MHHQRLFESIRASIGSAEYRGKQSIVDFISGEVYCNPERYGFDSSDDAADALLRYRNRIDGLVDKYLQCGHPFDRFIETGLLYMAKSIRRENRKTAEREFVCECPDLWRHEGVSIPDFSGPGSGKRGMDSLKDDGLVPSSRDILAAAGPGGRRLIYLFLKCAFQTTDGNLENVALRANVPVSWLSGIVSVVRLRMEGERLRFGAISESRNAAWTRIYNLEARMQRECEPGPRQKLSVKLGKEKARFAGATSRISHFKTTVPNSVVAEILGVPKGTIDSSLYYLKRHSSLPADDKNV